ncbi:MAG: TonB-dependent receptor [Kofleriaceae bacterium]
MRVVALLLLLLSTGIAVGAPRTVRGVVTRLDSRRPIVGASVLTDRGAIAVTDLDGFFTIVVAPADRELTIAANGFITRSVRIPAADALVRVGLEAASGAEVIEVTGKAPEETKPLSYNLTVDEIRAIPGAGNDVLRAATVLPGVARIPYSFGGLVLRGSSPRDTAIYLDGVEVPIAFHFGGVTSFYPGGMLSDLAVTAGGFDTSFGRSQGGIVTLGTREPRTDRWRMGGSIGLFDSSIQAEGPVKGGGVIMGLRRSYFDRIVDPFIEEDAPLPSYYDAQIRMTFGDPRKRGRITPMIFTSIDRVASNEVSITSTFVRLAAPYLRQWGKLALRIVPWIGANTLTFSEEAQEDQRKESFSRPLYPGGVRAEAIRDFTWGHLRGGLELDGGYLAPSQFNFSEGGDDDGSVVGTTTIAWTNFAAFLETRWKIDGERFAVKPGLRVEGYGLTGEIVVDPRLNIHQRLTDTLTFRQAIGRFHQPPTPADVDPDNGNPQLDSSYTDQFSLGFDAELPAHVRASVTGYYNDGREIGVKVQNPAPGSEPPDLNLGGLGPTFELLLEKQLGIAFYRDNVGRARSYGLEVSIKRNVGPWFALLSYTLSKSERVDDPRLAAGWRPFELDQRHNLQLATSYQYRKWRLGARLQLVSGNPYSPSRVIDTEQGPQPVEVPWAGQLPLFVSIDLRADRRWHRCWGDIVLFIDVQNAINRRNVEGREFDYETLKDADIRGLPIIPFIGVEFRPLI